MTVGRRHVLVIASQCQTMDELVLLGEAARNLHDALRAPDIGACAPGLPDGDSLVIGNVESAKIASLVRQAIGHAAEHEAVLVLAMLGHGFIPGTDSTLYLMGWNAREGVRDTAVDVRALLIEAADRAGVQGVVGIIDTCTAAAAAPATAELISGTRAGQTQLSLLLASAKEQPAYDMRMSRELTRLLQNGLAEGSTHLRLGDLKTAIQDALDKQDLLRVDFDGATDAEPVWLAHNRHYGSHDLAGTSYGMRRLHAALRELPGDRRLPMSLAELRGLHEELSLLPQDDPIGRAVAMVDSLIAAHRTVTFLRRHMAASLSTMALRRAIVAARGASGPYQADDAGALVLTETDAVERAALDYPLREGNCRLQIARFVVALADDAGVDLAGDEFREWAESIGALVPFNDAVHATRDSRSRRRFRLIVSYYSLSGEWPVQVRAWVLHDDVVSGYVEFPTERDQAGAERALVEAVDWAEEKASELDAGLECIEVGMSARMLLEWCPEQTEYGDARLGVNYRVLSRWSQRLDRSRDMRRINRNASKRMAEVVDQASSTVHWLETNQVDELDQLRANLTMGKYAPVAGLLNRPGQGVPLLGLLLRYVPILLWPQGASLEPDHCEGIRSRWHALPDAFLLAYRERWANREESDLIADIRAVWDDMDWLRFCGSAGTQLGD